MKIDAFHLSWVSQKTLGFLGREFRRNGSSDRKPLLKDLLSPIGTVFQMDRYPMIISKLPSRWDSDVALVPVVLSELPSRWDLKLSFSNTSPRDVRMGMRLKPVLRGGSWNNNDNNCRVSNRNNNNPDNSNNNIGFRVSNAID